MLTTLTLALSLLSIVNAQSSNNTQLQIEAIQAHFSNAGLVPSLLTTFSPDSILNVTYGGTAITPGEMFTKDQVANAPTLYVTPANGSVSLTGSKYTVAMVDAGIVGTDESQGQTRHWLVNSASLSGNSAPYTVTYDGATIITDYAGPGPASGSGAHRYVLLVLPQGDDFSPPDDLSQPDQPVATYDFADYVKTSNLGAPIAGNYIQVEEGTATATVSSTSAVVTSTLAAALSSSTSGSRTSSASSSSSTSTSSTSSAQSTALFSTPLIFVASLVALMVM